MHGWLHGYLICQISFREQRRSSERKRGCGGGYWWAFVRTAALNLPTYKHTTHCRHLCLYHQIYPYSNPGIHQSCCRSCTTKFQCCCGTVSARIAQKDRRHEKKKKKKNKYPGIERPGCAYVPNILENIVCLEKKTNRSPTWAKVTVRSFTEACAPACLGRAPPLPCSV